DRPLAVPEASLIAGRTMGLQAAVLEAAKWLAGVRHAGQDAVCTLDTIAFRAVHHQVIRRPQCAECGDPGLVAAQGWRPVTPASRPKPDQGDGHHRAVPPASMLERHRHLVSSVTGVVTELRRSPHAPEGINAYVSGRNLALSGHSLAGVRSGLRTMSGGKGTTALEAEVGALCEAVERYCATRQGDEPTVWDSLRGLGENAIHPNACQLFDDRQFRDRDRWNAGRSAFQQVCPRFEPDRVTEWTPVWSLSRGAHRMLPTSMLYYVREPDFSHVGLPWADSNGNAAGSSVEDAVVHGFLELVERDAVALWWYNRTRHPAVDLDAFDEPWLAALRRTHAALGRSVWALDLTSDLGVPVVAAVSHRAGAPAEEIAFGFGAHFDPRTALRRALTEMGQLLPPGADPSAAPSQTRETLDADPELTDWWQHGTVRNQPYLLPDPGESPRTPGDFAFTAATDFRQETDAAERLVGAAGMELLVLDQSRPDVGIPVVKVLVPGLRHFWARFAPGRLFDVPVQTGLLARPTAYESLNPIPLFV
ncbi:TOMM precursor leader peptide-binding protein, partial [Streptomyces sparsus]